MNLSPKALNALVDIKKRLIQPHKGPELPVLSMESVMITPVEPLKRKKRLECHSRMRHAKAPNAYQRWKQNREGW